MVRCVCGQTHDTTIADRLFPTRAREPLPWAVWRPRGADAAPQAAVLAKHLELLRGGRR